MEPLPYITVITTAPVSAAKNIADAVIDSKLAACVQIIPGMTSLYWWEGKKEESQEVLILMKTKNLLSDSLQTLIKSVHPYKVPEIIVQPIIDGNRDYFAWMESILKK